MIPRLIVLATLAWVLAAGGVLAQSGALPDLGGAEQSAEETPPSETGALELSEEEAAEAEALPAPFDDQDEWRAFAARVGKAVAERKASSPVLDDLRAQLTGWRDLFLSRESTNSARIATLESQIDALGTPPETGEEDARITARRADLTQELERLRAPGILASEAYSQADGLIAELDALLRDRQAARFTERSQSPLNPTLWPGTWAGLLSGTRAMVAEARTAVANPSVWRDFLDVLPFVLVLLLIAFVFVLRGRPWYDRASAAVAARTNRSRNVVRFVLSFGRVAIPFVGLLAFSTAVQISGFAGRRIDPLLEALPLFGLLPILARWIADHLLPADVEQDRHPLLMTSEVSRRTNRRFVELGYALALFGLVVTFAQSLGLTVAQGGVLLFPVGLLMAWSLYWFAHRIRNPDMTDDDDIARSFRMTLRSLLSKGLKLAAVGGVIFAVLGYANAFAVLVFPAALTVYVLCVMMMLQRLSVDVYSMVSQSEDAAQNALAPVLIGFALILLSLPILALIWGAQLTDLTELWARFREGFSIGETRISPTSFLLFALVFVVGYTVTRLVQAALRTTVLPRTKLDTGGQNAAVAGMGYIGIFLAAVIAITTAGIDLSGLAIVAGALSVGIGFGLQTVVSNFVSGIILLIERPISQGDWIEVGGQMGYVRDISVRSTRIETFDRTDVIVPNADLVSNQVINWTRGNNVGRVIVPVGVGYGTDTERVKDILQEIAESHPMVILNPPPAVLFQGFGADSLSFEIRAILRDVNWVMHVKSDMNHAIAKRFAEEGIEIPFSQRDIWLRNPEALRQPQTEDERPGQGSAGDPDQPSSDTAPATKTDPDVAKGEAEEP